MANDNDNARWSNPALSVAIVDDDDDVRSSLANLLQSAGYSTASFDSGEALFRKADWAALECILLDIRMKGMNGIEVLKKLSAQGVKTPAIVLSAHCDEETRNQAKLAGARVFICKPFDEDELINAVSLAFGERHDA